MALRFIDTETTGMDPEKDAIVEIASCDLYPVGNGAHDVTRLVEHLVFPERAIPPEASAVHHLTDRDVAHAPRLVEIIDEFKCADAYVAHNAEFDRKFLEPHIGEQRWICTYKVALRIWPTAPGHGNQTLRYWLGLVEPFGRPRDAISAHRALSDVIVTAAVFVEMLKHATWRQMQEWSAEPPLHTFCRFGAKHKGKRFDQIAVDDPSYLSWIVDKSDLDAGVKFSAAYWQTKAKEAAMATLMLILTLASGNVRQFEIPASDCKAIERNHAAGWRTEFDDLPANTIDPVIDVSCVPPPAPIS